MPKHAPENHRSKDVRALLERARLALERAEELAEKAKLLRAQSLRIIGSLEPSEAPAPRTSPVL